MKYKLHLIFLYFFFQTSTITSQVISLVYEDTLCTNEPLEVTNTSSGLDQFQWDFCLGDLEETPLVSFIANEPALETPFSLELINNDGFIAAIVPSRGNNTLNLLEFSNDLSSIIEITDFGNFDNNLDGPTSVSIIDSANRKFGFVTNLDDGNIIRAEFSTDYSSIISFENLGNYGSIINPDAIEIVNDSSNLYRAVVLYGSNVGIVDFGENITSAGSFSMITIPGSSRLFGLDLFKENNEWYGIASSFGNGKVYHLDFGTRINNNPKVTELANGGVAITSPADVVVVKDGPIFYALMNTREGNLIRYNFGPSLSNINPSLENLGNFELFEFNSSGLDIIKDSSEWIAISTNFRDEDFYSIRFNLDCPVSEEFIISNTPSVSFSENGLYPLEVTAINNSTNSIFIFDTLTVIDLVSPDVLISSDNTQCIDTGINFEAINASNDITSFDWDFQTETSTLENPVIQFDTAGIYNIRLDVEASNGCPNFTFDTLQIFEEPIADFSISGVNSCTNSPIIFSNSSQIFGAEEIVEYEWDFAGEGSSTAENTSFIFTTPGMKTINLTTSIPGCESFFSQSIEILPGPNVSFLANTVCFGETTVLNNTTTGDGITGFEWDFGNGTQSTLENPSVNYQSSGTFNVKLSATNTDGCVSTDSLLVVVNDVPAVDFSFDLACENADVQFFDDTEVSNSNISDRLWTFSDNLEDVNIQSSTLENPVVRFRQTGVFPVKLVSASSFGCVDSTTINVNVFNSPELNLSVESLCLNDSTTFSDLTTIEAPEVITSRLWEINGLSTSDSTFKTLFQQTGTVNATLTVSSSNFCVVDTTLQLNVEPLPEQNLLTDNTCSNEATEFIDLSTSPNDPIISRTWTFDGFGISNDSIAALQFSSAGSFSVSLANETENGCMADTSFSVTVLEAPEAGFSARNFIGGQPFTVDFINNSSNGNSFLWDFDFQGETSNEFEPTFTFEELGNYNVRLVAFNSDDCVDTIFNTISVVIPVLEMELVFANPAPGSNNERFILTLRNNGSIVLNEIEINVELNNGFRFREVVETDIFPDANPVNIPLSLEIPNSGDQGINFICFDVNARNTGLEEENSFNNSQCIPLDGSTSILTGFPNPATDQISVPVLANDDTQVVISVFSASGEKFQEVSFSELSRGLQNLVLDISGLTNGTYLLQISDGTSVSIQRFLKN